MKLNPGSPDATEWDHDFEGDFHAADASFSTLIKWLETCRPGCKDGSLRDRFEPTFASESQLRMLTECVVSLAVRSPLHRESLIPWVDPDSTWRTIRDEQILIPANMADNQRRFADQIGTHAKFAALYTDKREFIFGDGFFQNLHGQVLPPDPRVLVPLTPTMAVVIYRPFSMMVEPRLSTIALTDSEVQVCNHFVQAYSKNELFFRSELPVLDAVFTCREHLALAPEGSFVELLFEGIPGVHEHSRRLF